jgi:hypothetical protein
MRSALRWLRRLVLGVVLLGAIVVAVALIAAHTDWGRERLRERVEAALRRAFPGGARVGAVEGSILGTLTVRDVELDGRDHQPLVTIGALHAAVALWPLVVQTAQIDELVADDVHVFAHREPPAPSSSSSSSSGASPWRVELPHVEIHHATIEIEAGASHQTLAEVDVAGAATVDAAGVTMFGWAHGRWDGRAGELTATAAVVFDGRTRVPAALITLGSTAPGAMPRANDADPARDAIAVLAATELAVDLDHPSGTLAVSAPARLVATVFPELDLAGDVVATIDVVAATQATSRLEVNALAGETTLWASLHADLAAQTARGAISAHAVDLALATRGQLSGRGDLFALGTVHRAGGTVFLDLPRIVASSRAVDVRDQRVTGTLVVNAAATGTLAPVLEVAVKGTAAGDTVVVEDLTAGGPACGSARARVCDGRRPTIAIASVRVPFDLGITPGRTGEPPALDLTGNAVGKTLALDDAAITAVTGRFKLQVAAGVPLGEAHVTATGIRNAGMWLGTAHADIASRGDGSFRVVATAWPPTKGLEISAEGLVTPGPRTVARLDRTRVTLPNRMIWTGRGGSLAVTGAKIELRGVTMTSGDATLALRGDFARPTGVLVAHADADRFLASAIDARYRGIGRGSLDLTRRAGRWQADGTFTGSGLALAADATPLDGAAHVALAGRRATLDAYATSPALGRLELAFEADAPRDPFDPSAWRALDRSAIRNATITTRQVALAGLAALAGPSARAAQLTGTIDGTVNLAPADLRGALAVRGVELPGAALDGDLTFAPHDGDLGANATARLSGIAAADLTARFAVPAHPFDPATWQHRGRDLLQEATADLDDVAFDPELLARLGVAKLLAGFGVSAPYRGRASVELVLGAAATEARVAIDLNDVIGGPLVERISEHIAINAGAQGTHLRAALVGHGTDHDLDLGVLEADVPMTTDRWIVEPATVLRAPIAARWALPVTPVSAILAIVDRHDLTGGTLEGSATIRGTLATPIVESARLIARDVVVPPRLGGHPLPVLRELEVVGTWGGASGTIAVTGREATGGELRAFANGRPDAPAGVTGWLTATRFDLAPIAVWSPRALVPTAGVVTSADLRLRAGNWLTGEVHVIRGTLPIAAAIGTLRDVAADVTIDDRAITGTIDGKLGRGTVRLTAETTTDLATIDVRELQLQDVSVLGSWRPIITAKLATADRKPLQRRDGVLRGEVTVRGARITLPQHAGTPLLDANAPADLVFAGAPEAVAAPGPRAPAHPWLVVDVALAPTRLDARDVVDSVGLGGKGTLSSEKLTVSIGDTVGVVGKVTIDSAYADFLGRRYLLDPSDLEFDGTTDPRLGIRMTHQIPELALNVTVRGRASLPEPQFSSDPGGYSRDQLVGFFVGGAPGGDPGSQTGEAVKGAVALGISGQLGRRISKVFPIQLDALSCEPATTATSASCSVGKWLSQRLFLTYRHPVEPRPDENANDLQVQYRLGGKALIDMTGGDRGHLGLDLLWRHRW